LIQHQAPYLFSRIDRLIFEYPAVNMRSTSLVVRDIFRARPRLPTSSRFRLALLLCFLPSCNEAQSQKPQTKLVNPRQHYDAARTFQLAGDQERAAAEYKSFLAAALRGAANAQAHVAQFEQATNLFEEATRLAPEDDSVQLDYASLRLQQKDFAGAQSLVEQVIARHPKNTAARVILGQILFGKHEYEAARKELEVAVVAAPSFDVGYLLGLTYIKLNDLPHARMLFEEMITGLGDSAEIHMRFGRAYGNGEWEALNYSIDEFKKAIVKNDKLPQAHYFLALAYLGRDGESGFKTAVPELEAEVKLSPNDERAHYLLGYIALRQQRFAEAEKELLRAAEIDPQNPDPLISLGQLYTDKERDSEAETILRKAIAVTTDVSRNEYQINRAHYLLGRILLRSGRKDEGAKELAASKELRDRAMRPNETQNQKLPELANLSEKEELTALETVVVSPETRKQADDYLNEIRLAVADSYNNLGVISASQKAFSGALEYFRKAADWDPLLETLDRNTGMAAFYANQFDQATAPLSRVLKKNPNDVRARAALGLTWFSLQEFRKTIATLSPITNEVDNDPGLGYAYATSLVKTGDYTEGVQRLQNLSSKNPNSADIHALLGEAFAEQKEYSAALEEYRKALAIDPNQARSHFLAGVVLIHQGESAEAEKELRAALKINPTDVASKYYLAYALIQRQEKTEAFSLLRQVIDQDPKYADAYYELGKLLLERGDVKDAISNLEVGTRLTPDSDYIHYQLAMAYRRDSRNEDAQRELKLYQTLKNRNRGRDVPESN